MDYQAQFFHRNPDSGYAILADTVQQPFNEFLRIAVDYGLGGIIGNDCIFDTLLSKM